MNTSAFPIRIQLIENILISEAGMRCLLSRVQDFSMLEHVLCGVGCGQPCVAHEPDVLLMVLGAGKGCDLDCVKQIVRRHPDIRMLVLCLGEDVHLTKHLIGLGVKGVICGHTPLEIIFRAIREVAAGRSYIDTDVARAVACLGSNGGSDPFACLTIREYEIVRLMLDGLSQEEVGNRLFISAHTVANHHSNIMKKLNIGNHILLTKLAIRHNVTTA